MEDPVRPSEEAFKASFAKGYRTWASLHDMIRTGSELEIPLLDCFSQPQDSSFRHPQFPTNLAINDSASNLAFAKGTSSWKTSPGCELPSFEEEFLISVASKDRALLTFPDKQDRKSCFSHKEN